MSYLLHEIRNRSGKTVKSGRTKSVKSRLDTVKPLNRAAKQRIVDAVETEMMAAGEVEDTAIKYVLTNEDISDEFQSLDVAVKREVDENWIETSEDEAVSDDLQNNVQVQWNSKNPSTPSPTFVNCPSIPSMTPGNPSVRSATSGKPKAEKVVGVDTDWKLKYRSPTSKELKKYCAAFEISPTSSVIKRQAIADLRQYVPYEVEPILGDGHCGYRTVSFLLTGTQNHYMTVRQKLCSWIGNGDLGADFMRSICPEIVPMKAKAKASSGFVGREMWMGIDDLFGLAVKLEINVLQFDIGTKTWTPFNDYYFAASRFAPLKDAPSLLIQFTGNHYEAIKSVKKRNQ